ncbi:MAG: serine/threonine protein kinase, partial [Myxococcales bacterium]|nr:serine/threonine protein kinase [Myxococcales bacterium]
MSIREPTPAAGSSVRLPVVDDAPRVGEEAFVVPEAPMARGGMAEVFEAQDRRLPRPVILKRPRHDDHLAAEDLRTFEDRLEAEALVLARLQHPAIVTLYEVGRDRRGRPFCVLQKVEGRSLRARLDELAEAEAADGAPRTRERLELLAGLVAIAEALAYAHERGIVHRDVTPNNVLLGDRGEMTLIDWGLAKDTQLATIEAGLARALDGALAEPGSDMTIGAGTPPYVCYEQTQGQPADPGYDVYSLGVTLYEVVAGRTPYRFEIPADAAGREQAIGSFLRWAERGPEPEPAAPRDAELSGIIARAMARSSEDRFTADELLRALRQYLTGELVFSHRYSLSGRLGRWVRRHRGVTISAMLAAVAVVAALLSWSALRTRDAERAREKARDEALVLAQRVEAAEAQTRAAEAEQR